MLKIHLSDLNFVDKFIENIRKDIIFMTDKERYSKVVDLEKEKSAIYHTASNEADMLTGNKNRMFVCDDIEELDTHLEVAKIRIEKIYELNKRRLEINAEIAKFGENYE